MIPLSQEQIDEFVVAAHFDLPKVQAMLAENPLLLNENAEWLETPIQAAAHVGNVEIAHFLLDQGAPLDICTAAMLGRLEDVQAMLAENPLLAGATGAHNIPVLYYPMIYGHGAIASLLLIAGADPNAGEGNNTPLHGAARFGTAHMVDWLLEHDVNPYALDSEGKTAYDYAVERGHEDVIELLEPFMSSDEDA